MDSKIERITVDNHDKDVELTFMPGLPVLHHVKKEKTSKGIQMQVKNQKYFDMIGKKLINKNLNKCSLNIKLARNGFGPSNPNITNQLIEEAQS